jgi:excisionase family DNA binding protein
MPDALVHSITEACAISRTGRTALYEAIKSGDLAARKRGRRTLILASDLQRWLESLPPIVPRDSVAPDRKVSEREAA